MKTLFVTILTLALFLPTAVAANPQQSGSTSDCTDSLATFVQSSAVSPFATTVSVQPGSLFVVSASAGAAYVDFFNAAGQWVGWNAGNAGGRVPFNAAFGTMCVGTPNETGIPIPDPTASWTYQDGF